MAMIDSAYQYYLSTYSGGQSTRYDSHKKSELRNTYNSIVKANSESPLYKIKNSGDVKKFAIDIKESTRSIKNVIASLSNDDDDITRSFRKKIAVSDNEDAVTVEYIGSNNDDNQTNSFQLEVRSLATPQINLGNYLDSNQLDLKPGIYGFDLNTSTNSYEFQYSVSDDDTNLSIQRKLSKLISNSISGLEADVIDNHHGMTALQIRSKRTGLLQGEEYLFSFLPQATTASMKAMDLLGINHIDSSPHNSSFLLNGVQHASYSNTFTINKAFEITLHQESPEGEPVTVGFKTDSDTIADNISDLMYAYNSILYTAQSYQNSSQNSSKLISDIGNVANRYKNELKEIGVNIKDDSTCSINRDQLKTHITSQDATDAFRVLNSFKDSLANRVNQISIDPMNYVDKVVVAYKQPGHNFITPYISSVYSGLIVDQFA